MVNVSHGVSMLLQELWEVLHSTNVLNSCCVISDWHSIHTVHWEVQLYSVVEFDCFRETCCVESLHRLIRTLACVTVASCKFMSHWKMSDSYYRSCSVAVLCCKAWSCWVYKLCAAGVISFFVSVHSLYCDVNRLWIWSSVTLGFCCGNLCKE